MSAPRKRWRLKMLPAFIFSAATSKRQAYVAVERERDLYALGVSRTHQINVEVDEGDGWALYERVVFPTRVTT